VEIQFLKLPIDLPRVLPFRQLQAALGFARSLSVWFLLYQDLAYRMREGQPPGRMPLAEQGQFVALLQDIEPEAAAREGVFQALLDARVLRVDGGQYVCDRFIAAHAGGEQTPSGVARLGGLMRGFQSKQRRLQSQAFQQSLNILPDKFKDEAGEPLSPELVDRVTRLIITCDNALGKPTRPASGFTEGLIQSAVQVANRFDDDQIDHICRQVVFHRGHPRIVGLTTERLLPAFGGLSHELNPE
jgi:hypothetical protein